MSKITVLDLGEIKVRYIEGLERLRDLAGEYGVTRQALWKRLRGVGVDTSKAQRVELVCDGCGEVYRLHRSAARRSRGQLHHFCSNVCYFLHLENRDSLMNRHGSRVGRGKVADVFDLGAANIVHHADGNQLNNFYSNLEVFVDQASHIRYHRGFDEEPIWRGSDHADLRGM